MCIKRQLKRTLEDQSSANIGHVSLYRQSPANTQKRNHSVNVVQFPMKLTGNNNQWLLTSP